MSKFIQHYDQWGLRPLQEAEDYLVNTCMEYGINYDTYQIVTPVQEGVFSSIVGFIKTLIQKVIAFFVKIFKFIINAIKTLVNKIIAWFKKLFGGKEVKKIEVKSMVLDSNGKFVDKTFTSTNQIQDTYKTLFSNFGKEIKQLEHSSIEYMKKYDKNATKVYKESASYAEEAYISNNTYGTTSMYGRSSGRTSDIVSNRPEGGGDTVIDMPDEIGYIQIRNMGIIDIRDEYAIYAEGYDAFKRRVTRDILDWCERVCETFDGDLQIKSYCEDIRTGYRRLTYFENDNKALDIFSESFFPSFNDIEDENERKNAINTFIQLRVNWNKSFIRQVEKMMEANKQFLNLSSEEIKDIVELAKYGDYEQVRQVFDTILDSCGRGSQIVDCRKFGLGVLCFSDELYEEYLRNTNRRHRGHMIYETLTDTMDMDYFMTCVTKYDLTIMAHGIKTDDYDSFSLDPSTRARRWLVQRTPLPNGMYVRTEISEQYTDEAFTDVNAYIREAAKLGFKRILCAACNPNHAPLDEDIVKSKKVLVRASVQSVFT